MCPIWLPNQEADGTFVSDADRAEARRAFKFSERLRDLDTRLECLLCTQTRDDFRAGYYYITRRNEDGTTAMWELSDPDGRPLEPSEAHIEAFRKADSNRAGFWDDVHRERERREHNAIQARKDLAAELTDELVGTLAPKTQIVVPG